MPEVDAIKVDPKFFSDDGLLSNRTNIRGYKIDILKEEGCIIQDMQVDTI